VKGNIEQLISSGFGEVDQLATRDQRESIMAMNPTVEFESARRFTQEDFNRL